MSEDENSSTGRWTIQEHEKFLLGLQLYGKDWKKIQELIGTRNSSQIRSHAQKYFLKLKKSSKRKSPNSAQYNKLQSPEIPSQTQSHIEKQQSQSSYFMNKIIQYTRSHQNLDIWDALIENKSPQRTVAKLQKQGYSNNMTIQENIKELSQQKSM